MSQEDTYHNQQGSLLSDGFVMDTTQESDSEAMIVDVGGFEGPLDLLLNMARNQKIDISKISILELANQYLDFIHEARKIQLELAADYLVMAAWLAYLKSRLLLPDENNDDEPTGEELAAALAFRLKRLEAMREAAAKLTSRDRLGRDIFARGMPEPVIVTHNKIYKDNLYDLLSAYAQRRQTNSRSRIVIKQQPFMSIKEARERLEDMLGVLTTEWSGLHSYLVEYLSTPENRRSAIASGFSASLEMVKEGHIEIRQTEAFEEIFIRKATNNRLETI